MDVSNRALITGVSGFAGQHLARQLVEEGWHVTGTTRTRVADVPGVTEHSVDLQDGPALRRLVDDVAPDVIFHLAAIVDTVTTPDIVRLHETNVMGTVRALEALRDSGGSPKFVYASSSFVYGATPPEAQPVTESQPLRPQTPYGASKAAGETIVKQFVRETGAFAVITRAFQHTGPGHVGAYALANWAEQVTGINRGVKAAIRCGNIDVERDYLDVRDIASAYRAVAVAGQKGEVYNVCSGQPVTMRALLEGLISVAGVDAEIVVEASRLRRLDQPTFYGDPGKLRSHTGWAPRFTLEATLSDLVDFWRERRAQPSRLATGGEQSPRSPQATQR